MSKAVSFDIVIVGGGPAGIAAACAAAESGKRVALIDSASDLGGNIWRGQKKGAATRWLQRFEKSGTTRVVGTVFAAGAHPKELCIESNADVTTVAYGKLILATGARELFLPFPGWTLPGVMGVGGLQALVKQGWPIRGKRVVVAGTGPLLLAAAAGLRSAGAKIVAIVEQTSASAILKFVWETAPRAPAKILQGLGLKARLIGVRSHTASWVSRAEGGKAVQRVTITNGRKTRSIDCDYLACAYGLIPNLELPALLECHIHDGRVPTDAVMQTTHGIFCVGETTGIGGVDCALIEGQIAGYLSAGNAFLAALLAKTQRRARVFASLLEMTFALRPELKALAQPDTIVCRCEDVPRSAMESHPNFRSAKLHTRCGMGPCQGRICGPAAKFLFNWTDTCDAPRPPVFPVRLKSLAQIAASPESLAASPSPDSASSAQGK